VISEFPNENKNEEKDPFIPMIPHKDMHHIGHVVDKDLKKSQEMVVTSIESFCHDCPYCKKMFLCQFASVPHEETMVSVGVHDDKKEKQRRSEKSDKSDDNSDEDRMKMNIQIGESDEKKDL